MWEKSSGGCSYFEYCFAAWPLTCNSKRHLSGERRQAQSVSDTRYFFALLLSCVNRVRLALVSIRLKIQKVSPVLQGYLLVVFAISLGSVWTIHSCAKMHSWLNWWYFCGNHRTCYVYNRFAWWFLKKLHLKSTFQYFWGEFLNGYNLFYNRKTRRYKLYGFWSIHASPLK